MATTFRSKWPCLCSESHSHQKFLKNEKFKIWPIGYGLVIKTMEANVVRRSRMALMKTNVVMAVMETNVVMAVMETNMVMMETNVAMMDTNVVVGHDGGQCGQGVL